MRSGPRWTSSIQASQAMATRLYQQAAPQSQATAGEDERVTDDDDVVEAEIIEDDDEDA